MAIEMLFRYRRGGSGVKSVFLPHHKVAIFLGVGKNRGLYQLGVEMREISVRLHQRGPLVRVPGLTAGQRGVLQRLIEIEDRSVVQRVGFEQARSAVTRALRELIRVGCVDVMGASPAVYRVTRLGRIALRLRGER